MKAIWFVLACTFCSNARAAIVHQEISLPDENQDAFVVRIASKMYEYTHKNGHEVCGALRFDGTNYSIEITTSERNDECTLPADTEIYVHTHPVSQGFHFSTEDYVRPGYLISYNVIKFQNGGRVRTVAKRQGIQHIFTSSF